MLNKENLLCTSTDAPEPSYVPAKLTIGEYGFIGVLRRYGYSDGYSFGELNPNSLNGTQITNLYVHSNGSVYATVPFYYENIKYSQGSNGSYLQSQWPNLVGQTVDIWLSGGGVKTLIRRAIAALSGGLRDAWKGNASWRNWSFSVCARGNRRSSGPNGKSLLLRSTISSLRRDRGTFLDDIRRNVGKIPLGSQLPLRFNGQQFDHRLRLQNRVCLWANKQYSGWRTLGCSSNVHTSISNVTFLKKVT